MRNTTARFTAWATTHPWAGPTVWGALLFVLAASVARAFTYPPLGSADEPAHLDYVVTLWHGHLPVFEDGLTYRVPWGVQVPVQWVAQHPPLYYLLLAPVVGPLWDGGHPLLAVMAGRALSALLIAVAVPAAAWAAWRCFPGHRRLPGAAAVVTAFAGIIVQQGSSIYNDALYDPLVVLACGIAGAALRTGVTRRLLVGATLVVAAGMTTRLSFALWAVAVVVAFLLARDVRLWRGPAVVTRITAALLPVVAAAAASGWFYLRNRALTGNLSGRQAEWGLEHANRVERSVTEVATDGTFWRGVFGIYRGAVDPLSWSTWLLLLVPLLLGLAAGVTVLLGGRRAPEVPAAHAHRSRPTTAQRRDRLGAALVVLMFVAVTVLLVVTEVDYVAGGGSPNTRYSMTVMPVLTIVMAAGLTWWRRASWLLVTAWIVGALFPYWTLVDLHVAGMVPHAARVVQLAFVLSLLGAVVCAVGAFLEARAGAGTSEPAGDGSPVATAPGDPAAGQDRAAASSSR